MGEDYGNHRIYDRTPDGTAIGSRLSAGSKDYFIQDQLGSVVGIIDKDGGYYGGYSYGPCGEPRFTSSNSALSNNHLRYISGYYDTSNGVYKLGVRYYDPSIGRFTQVDPSGSEANLYAYGTDNPINKLDPSGYISKKAIRDIVEDIDRGFKQWEKGKTIWDVVNAFFGSNHIIEDLADVAISEFVGDICETAVIGLALGTFGISLVASVFCYALAACVVP